MSTCFSDLSFDTMMAVEENKRSEGVDVAAIHEKDFAALEGVE